MSFSDDKKVPDIRSNSSIIDFLASEIANDLLRNPENLKFQISEKIKEMVYNKKPVRKAPVKKAPVKKASPSKLKKDLNSITEKVVEKAEPKSRRKKETEQE